MGNTSLHGTEDISELRGKLIGALVGLARATEGNSHKLTETTDKAMLSGLCALADENVLQADVLTALLSQIDNEKRKLIPNCYGCASPCGRNNDYDTERLYSTQNTPAALRLLLLSGVASLAAAVRQAYSSGIIDSEVNEYFYRVLYSVGMDDWDERELMPMVTEFAAIERRCANL